MTSSVFDLFKIGIGPSSSHTVGPMIAARRFSETLTQAADVDQVSKIRVELLGSLGATGKGHATDTGIILGLLGHRPESVDPDKIPSIIKASEKKQEITLLNKHPIHFVKSRDLIFDGSRTLPQHSNGMIFTVLNAESKEIASDIYFSIGGGFVLNENEVNAPGKTESTDIPFPFSNAAELLDFCHEEKCSVSDLMLANEIARGETEESLRSRILEIWETMKQCVARGTHTEGMLPGALKLHRRAPELYRKLKQNPALKDVDPLASLDWVDQYALAVGEENACGGRVVTAPTNGASGVIPAVLHYCVEILATHDDDRIVRFFLTAAAIGSLYKENASLSAAEVGCQGEIGVACSMAAGALAEYRGGTPGQVQNAAEIGMEHNLGLTCDPIGGLVQIPCIERNAMGAVKAINASRMALRRDRPQHVSLDSVIKTMRETGRDMNAKYKETSEGGLAVNVPEC